VKEITCDICGRRLDDRAASGDNFMVLEIFLPSESWGYNSTCNGNDDICTACMEALVFTLQRLSDRTFDDLVEGGGDENYNK